jgi:protein-S-isoprenylcysteine O-methyltransferase Ste14
MPFRWIALAVFVGALSVSAYHRRRARDRETIARTREGGALMAARALVAVPLLISPLAYVAHPPAMAWASFAAPEWLRWTGVALGVAVVASVHWVLSNLGRNVSETVLTKESHELVVTGPYRWIRHPLYTTGTALFLALGLIAANWFILLCAAAALAGILLVVIPREERELRARFGAAYDDLVSRTGAMWPRLGGTRETR